MYIYIYICIYIYIYIYIHTYIHTYISPGRLSGRRRPSQPAHLHAAASKFRAFAAYNKYICTKPAFCRFRVITRVNPKLNGGDLIGSLSGT